MKKLFAVITPMKKLEVVVNEGQYDLTVEKQSKKIAKPVLVTENVNNSHCRRLDKTIVDDQYIRYTIEHSNHGKTLESIVKPRQDLSKANKKGSMIAEREHK